MSAAAISSDRRANAARWRLEAGAPHA